MEEKIAEFTSGVEFDLDSAVSDPKNQPQIDQVSAPHMADEVIFELIHRALEASPTVRLAETGLSSVLSLGRKGGDGMNVDVDMSTGEPVITLDVYVLMKYGLRIPDTAWDLQEHLKKELERVTGYEVKAVNLHVQGLFFPDPSQADHQNEE